MVILDGHPPKREKVPRPEGSPCIGVFIHVIGVLVMLKVQVAKGVIGQKHNKSTHNSNKIVQPPELLLCNRTMGGIM
jgi:hypothetical protein